jgi:hypothetical protein
MIIVSLAAWGPVRAAHVFRRGEVAQLVEHTTENRSVDSSILSLATISKSSSFIKF